MTAGTDAQTHGRTVAVLGGIPGVLVAAFIVKSRPLTAVKWLVVGVLTYTSALMYQSAKGSAPATGAGPASA